MAPGPPGLQSRWSWGCRLISTSTGEGPTFEFPQAAAKGASSRLRTGVPAFSSQIPQVAPRSWPCGPLHIPIRPHRSWQEGVSRGPAAGSPRGCNTYTGLTAVTSATLSWGEAGGGLTQAQGEGLRRAWGRKGRVDISIQSQHVPKTTFLGPRAENRHREGLRFSRQLNQDSEGRNLKWGRASSSGSGVTCIVDMYNVCVTHIYIHIYTCTHTTCI